MRGRRKGVKETKERKRKGGKERESGRREKTYLMNLEEKEESNGRGDIKKSWHFRLPFLLY